MPALGNIRAAVASRIPSGLKTAPKALGAKIGSKKAPAAMGSSAERGPVVPPSAEKTRIVAPETARPPGEAQLNRQLRQQITVAEGIGEPPGQTLQMMAGAENLSQAPTTGSTPRNEITGLAADQSHSVIPKLGEEGNALLDSYIQATVEKKEIEAEVKATGLPEGLIKRQRDAIAEAKAKGMDSTKVEAAGKHAGMRQYALDNWDRPDGQVEMAALRQNVPGFDKAYAEIFQEKAQQQGAQQSAEGAQTSTSTPAKPEAKAGGTTHDNGDKPDKASPQGSKPGSAEAKAIYEKAKGEIAALHARSKELSKYIADNPKADDLKTNEMELLAVQNEMQSLQGNLPQMRLQSLNYQELTEDTRFLLSGELKVLTDKKEGLENIFVNGERNMARREINRMYAILHAIKNPSAEQRKILEQAEKNRMEANVEGKALIDSKYQSNVGNILERIRAICRPWYKKGPLRLVTRLSESEEQVIAQEQMRALSGQLTPEKMEEYNKKGLLKLIRNILLLAIAIVTPVLLDTGNQTFTSTVQQQGGQ